MEKIRVLHIAQSAGGVDQYIRMLLKYSNKNRFDNILVCSQDYQQINYRGMVKEFEQIDMRRAICINDFKALVKIRKILKKYNPDIVYAHSSKAGVLTRMANLGLKNYCVYNPHGWSFNMECSISKKYFYILIEKLCAYLCNSIICISESEKISALTNKICKENKLHVILNGIDIQRIENKNHDHVNMIRETLNIPKDAFVIGMVGRISKQKSPDIFLKVANRIKNEITNAHFVIVGDGELKSEIIKFAIKNNLIKRLHITGWVDDPYRYIQIFDIACLLSRWEGFGLVLPEYMLAKKPIIANNIDAIPEIIQNEVNGLLVKVNDINEISRAVLRLHNDKELTNKLVANGAKDVYEKYDIKRVIQDYENIYKMMG